MDELIKTIFSAPVSTLFIVAGLIFLGIAVVGRISGKIDPDPRGRVASGILGVILLLGGLLMQRPSPASTPTHTVTPSANGPPGDPFVGAWEATDDSDGSHMTLSISSVESDLYQLDLYDEAGTVCGLDESGNPLFAVEARGSGTADGLVLSGTWPVWCLSQPRSHIGTVDFEFAYEPETDALTDDAGFTWHRD